MKDQVSHHREVFLFSLGFVCLFGVLVFFFVCFVVLGFFNRKKGLSCAGSYFITEKIIFFPINFSNSFAKDELNLNPSQLLGDCISF